MTARIERAPRRDRRSRRATDREHGLALAGAVILLALLLAATAATLWLTRSELWAAGRARAQLQARYSAESGVQHAVVSLAPGTSFAAVLDGSGGLARPGASGPLPLSGGWVAFPGPPFGYGVTPAAAGADERLVLHAFGTSVAAATRRVTATVGRARDAYAPAALVAVDGSLAIEPAVAGVSVDAQLPAGGAQGGIGASSNESAAAASAALLAAGGSLLGDAPTAVIDPIDFDAYRRAIPLAPVDPGGAAGALGAPGEPGAIALARGTLAGLAGTGALIAVDDLEVSGPLDLRGVLLVAGELRLAGSPCRVSGMVWARAVRFGAACTIEYDAGAIALADQALRLPRKAVLLAITDG